MLSGCRCVVSGCVAGNVLSAEAEVGSVESADMFVGTHVSFWDAKTQVSGG